MIAFVDILNIVVSGEALGQGILVISKFDGLFLTRGSAFIAIQNFYLFSVFLTVTCYPIKNNVV